jgi:bifunctional DNase/RNase
MLIEMNVEGLLFDPRSSMYILLLKEIEGDGRLPIWIGKPEADSIALALGKVVTPRPLTHDLIKNITDGLKVRITKIIVTEILENTYYALVCLNDGKKETLIDSRPSDAIAVALRSSAPIFVEESIMEKRSPDELEEWLKNLRPEDFGNIM